VSALSCTLGFGVSSSKVNAVGVVISSLLAVTVTAVEKVNTLLSAVLAVFG
jgi:hypothetical protein